MQTDTNNVKILHTKNAKSLLAKLMAEENITVQHKQVETASFDVIRRILTVPIWKDMGPDMYDLFMGHEVGHALWTPSDFDVLEDAIDRSNKDFVNVVEDARIEKFAKKKFPGLKGPFYRAYNKLVEDNFFGIGDKNLADMSFLDRLNIFYKSAMNNYDAANIFSDEEMPYVDRMGGTETFAEVADLSEEIYNYLKESQKEREENQLGNIAGMMINSPQKSTESSGEGESQESVEDSDQSQSAPTDGEGEEESTESSSEGEEESTESSGEGEEESTESSGEGEEESTESSGEGEEESDTLTGGKKGGTGVDEFTSVTDTTATESMRDMIDREAGDINYLTLPNFKVEDFVVGWKDVQTSIETLKEIFIQNTPSHFLDNAGYDKTNLLPQTLKEENKTIQYLVKEFEMKKSAEAYSNQTVAKSGNINTSKLWSYKLNDDIFQRKSILPDGKNHGLVMVVDWSGSMHNCLYKTVVQVITLATFARRVGIPFEVYNFTDQGVSVEGTKDLYEIACNEGRNSDNMDRIMLPYGTLLRQMLTNKMKNREFINACNNYLFLAHLIQFGGLGYGFGGISARANALGGTPLVASLQILEKVVHKFQKENQVEKLSYIVLSDGDAADGIEYTTDVKHSGWASSTCFKTSVAENREQNWVITDERSGKTIVWKTGSRGRGKTSTEMMLELIKTLHNAMSVGFYIVNNNSDLTHAINAYCFRGIWKWRRGSELTPFKKEARVNGFISAKDCGYDEYYIVDQRTQGEDKELDIDTTMTKAKIARNFSKFQSSKKTSRMMLNKFVDLVK